MAIPAYALLNFDALLRAAGDGNLALMECLDAVTRQPRYVLCAVGRSESDYVFTPFGHLAEGNPYDAYLPPDPDEPGGFIASQEDDERSFEKARMAEFDSLPEFSISTLHIVSGLLLPIWRLLPQDTCRVYRLETDDGERIVGRVISPSALSVLSRNLGVDQVETVSAEQAWTAVANGSSVAVLASGLSLRRVRVMNEYRIELSGFTAGIRDWLKAAGLFSEIIAWETRFFVPMREEGPKILDRLMQRHRLIELSARG
ncbi:hypothetical protein NXC12_PE00288 (plasmid) [Rhizobium etli]|uniref:Uncharacterized protein n=1 Tax=Rhizobium etli TaxID=29449 RepID=A0AAN1BMF8_RHIET|nr:hypothetical protein REMIM1_PF00762 [Rhizobium etli bv. mimosae str. Mim1]ARQ13884.1 hypothetical protein NXC12_PE00288 [Rhizobium etli]